MGDALHELITEVKHKQITLADDITGRLSEEAKKRDNISDAELKERNERNENERNLKGTTMKKNDESTHGDGSKFSSYRTAGNDPNKKGSERKSTTYGKSTRRQRQFGILAQNHQRTGRKQEAPVSSLEFASPSGAPIRPDILTDDPGFAVVPCRSTASHVRVQVLDNLEATAIKR